MEEEISISSSHESDGEEDEERAFRSACRTLASMKYKRTDEDELSKLRARIDSTLWKRKSTNTCKRECSKVPNRPQIPTPPRPLPQLPAPGYSIDGRLLPALPPLEALRNFIGNRSPAFEKQLTPTDVDDRQSRISLNKAFVEANYLQMLNVDEKLDKGITVTTYGPDGEEFEMIFKFWCNKVYVINTGWKRFYKKYDLRAKTHWTTIWMFRHTKTKRLCFALAWKVIEELDELIEKPNKRKTEAA